MAEVTVPVAPQVEKGVIYVRITVVSQISRQTFDIDVEILVLRNVINKNRFEIIQALHQARRSHHYEAHFPHVGSQESSSSLEILGHPSGRIAHHSLLETKALRLWQSASFCNGLRY